MTKNSNPENIKKFRIVYDLAIPLTVSAIGLFLGSWLLLQYTQPQLTLYTDGYYQKSGKMSIGSLYVVNEGRQLDKNITIAIDEKINKDDLSINYTNSSWVSVIKGGLTYITVTTLSPGEGVEVVFNTKSDKPSFEIEDFSSESGNTHQKAWIEPWWYFTRLQLGLIFFSITIFFALGFAVGLWKEDVIRRQRI